LKRDAYFLDKEKKWIAQERDRLQIAKNTSALEISQITEEDVSITKLQLSNLVLDQQYVNDNKRKV
jgi:hypothetical protein